MDQRTEISLDDLPFTRDRGAGWHALMAAGPVAQSGEQCVLTTADAVEYATKHPELFSSAAAFDRLGSPLPLVPIAVDPPEHKRYRRMLDATFAPRRLLLLQDELRAQAAALVDAIAERGSCEVLADIATPYPTQVFLTLFGLPLEDRDQLVGWKDAILELTVPGAPTASDEVLVRALELHEYLTTTVSERRAGDGQGDDLLTELLAIRDEGGLTDEEIIGLSFLFVLAGLDTVTSAVAFALNTLAQRPDLRAGIVADPTTIPAFVEEILRVEVPVPFAPRIVMEDVEVSGCPIAAGTPVMLAYGAASRDPLRHADPDELLLGREERHFAFGGGAHRCLGSHLARMELKLVLEEWHRRIPSYELAAGAEPEVVWPAGTLVLSAVPLVVTAVAAP
jgi:cytochrome P450